MKNQCVSLCVWLLIAGPFAISTAVAQTTAPPVGPNFSVMAGECKLETNANGIVKYVGDCHLERQNEVSGAVSSNNPDRRLYCFNDYKLTASSEGAVIGGPTADSWIGCSMCVGERCQSFLIPGFPNDGTPQGMTSEVRKAGFNAAADPVVQPLPDGAFMVAFLAFNREASSAGNNAPNAGIFLQPIIDLENTEKDPADALALLPQITVDLTNEQLVDKPDLAFVPSSISGPQQMCKIGSVQTPSGLMDKSIPCGSVLTAFTIFNGQTDKNARSKINLCRHDLSGRTRDRCVRADERQHVDSGVALAPDPGNPQKVYLFWRRFATPNLGQTDTVVLSISTDGGATMGKALEIFSSVPFGDFPRLPQPGAEQFVLARSTAFLATAVAHLPNKAPDRDNPVYLCWAQRDRDIDSAQIVCSVSNNGGLTWSDPAKIDPAGPMDPSKPMSWNQFQPALDCAAGQCSLAWYDMRKDLFPTTGLPADLNPPRAPFIHTVDVRMTQWDVAGAPPSPPCYEGSGPACVRSFQISKYPLTMANLKEEDTDPDNWVLLQLQFNPLNPPTNCGGTCAFFGDYMDVFYPKWVRPISNGSVLWMPNIDPAGPRDVWLAWTANNQIRFPSDGDWTRYNVPLREEDQTGSCASSFDRYGLHNQDVFTARVSPNGFGAACPRCTKPLTDDRQRTFLLILENVTGDFITLKAKINAPSQGVTASFKEDEILTETDAGLSPFGKKARTVFVNCISNCSQPIEVTVTNTVTGKSTSVLLNAVSAVFPEDFDAALEIHDLSLLNTTFPSLSLLNVDPDALSLLNLSLLNNPENLSLLNLSLLNGGIVDLSLLNLGAINLSLLNTDPASLSLLNAAANLSLLNLSLLNSPLNLSLLNSSVGTKTWEISANNTSVASGYDLALLSDQGQVPEGFDAFVVVTRTRPALSFDGSCRLVSTPGLAGQELLAAFPLTNPTAENNSTVLTPEDLENIKGQEGFQNLSLLNSSLDDSTYPMSPGDKIQVTLVLQERQEQQSGAALAAAIPTQESGLGVADVLSQINLFSTAQATSSTGNLSHTPVPQRITVTVHAPVTATHDTSFTVGASASSGLPVEYSSGSPAVCTNVGAAFTMVSGSGTCIIQYDQAGDANYYPAARVSEFTAAQKAAAVVTLANLSQTYTGSPLTPTAATVPAGLTLVWTNVPQTNAGSYSVTATVNDNNYEGSASGTFIINKAAATATLNNLIQTYTGSPLTPTAATVPAGLTLVWTNVPQTNAGSYPVTATVNDGNYQGSASGTFIINKAAATVTLHDLIQTYTGSPLTPTAATVPGGLTLVWTNVPQTNAGSYPVTATVNDGNYQGSASGTFVISKANTTMTLGASPTTVMIGQAVTFTATVTSGASGTLTGTVTFYEGSTTLGSAALTGGKAALTISNLAAGTRSITAQYSGDNNFAPSSTQSPVAVNVTHRFDGFYPKLGPAEVGKGGTSRAYGPFKLGSTVALKWALFDAGNQFFAGNIADGKSMATIELFGPQASGGSYGSPVVLVAPGDTPGATLFRIDYSKPQYIFNWDTTKNTAGKYILAVTDADGGVHSVALELR